MAREQPTPGRVGHPLGDRLVYSQAAEDRMVAAALAVLQRRHPGVCFDVVPKVAPTTTQLHTSHHDG